MAHAGYASWGSSAIHSVLFLSGSWEFNISVGAAYDDLKWTFKNLKNMNKPAIVSESKVLGWLVAADSPFGNW